MLKKRTTFVVGAGASCDFGFPTGAGLQERIAAWLKLAPRSERFEIEIIENTLKPELTGPNWSEERSSYLRAAKRIVKAMPVAASIDNFVHTHQADRHIVWLGKIAIALAILEAEQAASIFVNDPELGRVPTLESAVYQKSWYFPLMRMLTMGSDASDARALLRNVRFVSFNYDRCLELIILLTLQRYYGLSANEAEAILLEAEIVHPYGQIGDLVDKGGTTVPFGANSIDVSTVAKGIRTFTESVDELIVQKAKRFVAECDTLVFLGFGFLPQNMELLDPRGFASARRIHATTFGFSESDKIVIQESLRGFMPPEDECALGQLEYVSPGSTRSGFIDVQNSTCRNLFDNHVIRLAA